MTQITNDMTEVEISVEEWLAIRKEAGKKIDPQTAVVTCSHGSPFFSGKFLNKAAREKTASYSENRVMPMRDFTFP